jgi:hypothetical protein
MTIETQIEELIQAVRGIDLNESSNNYTEHFDTFEWQLNEMRESLESIANSLKVIADR